MTTNRTTDSNPAAEEAVDMALCDLVDELGSDTPEQALAAARLVAARAADLVARLLVEGDWS